MTRIIAKVYFGNNSHGFGFGSHGCEEAYQENLSTQDYLRRFESETRRLNTTEIAVMFSIQKTIHNVDGTFKLDENGKRMTELLYVNEKLRDAIFTF